MAPAGHSCLLREGSDVSLCTAASCGAMQGFRYADSAGIFANVLDAIRYLLNSLCDFDSLKISMIDSAGSVIKIIIII